MFFLGSALSGYKFIHDATFWWNVSKLKHGLQWLSLYVMAHPDPTSSASLSETVSGVLEASLQRQLWFVGTSKYKFLSVVMNELDKRLP